ncbi:hypothetical protein L209DRAFT_125253 [Thermothelomyces heterothallicus CBS 203.75]
MELRKVSIVISGYTSRDSRSWSSLWGSELVMLSVMRLNSESQYSGCDLKHQGVGFSRTFWCASRGGLVGLQEGGKGRMAGMCPDLLEVSGWGRGCCGIVEENQEGPSLGRAWIVRLCKHECVPLYRGPSDEGSRGYIYNKVQIDPDRSRDHGWLSRRLNYAATQHSEAARITTLLHVIIHALIGSRPRRGIAVGSCLPTTCNLGRGVTWGRSAYNYTGTPG